MGTFGTYKGKQISLTKSGYETIRGGSGRIYIHVDMWEDAYGKKPEKMEIHHRDFNKRSNFLENFQLLTHRDHNRVHKGWIMEDGIWVAKHCGHCDQDLPLSDFVVSRGDVISSFCRKCLTKTKDEWQMKNPERRKAQNDKFNAIYKEKRRLDKLNKKPSDL